MGSASSPSDTCDVNSSLFWDWLVTCKIHRSPSADIYMEYFSETPRFFYYTPRYTKIGKILTMETARKCLP